MVKTSKNLLLQKQKSHDLETCNVGLGTQALQNLYENAGLTSTYFTARLNWVTWGKLLQSHLMRGKLAAKDYVD